MPAIFVPAATTSHPDVVPYISLADYISAPTAMDTTSLVPGGTTAQNQQELANTIRRASGWANSLCYQILAATLDTQMAAHLLVHSDGNIFLPCDFWPVLELDTCKVGPTPSTLSDVTDTADIWLRGRKVLVVPASGISATSTTFWYPGPLQPGARAYAQWSYWNGWPHTQLASNIATSDTTITVQNTMPQALAGRTMTIWDGTATETVTIGSTFTGGTSLPLVGKPANAHTVPAAPGSIMVSTFPDDMRAGVVHLTNAMIKSRGAEAMEMPTIPGGEPSREALIEGGGMEDLAIAVDLLEYYKRVA